MMNPNRDQTDSVITNINQIVSVPSTKENAASGKPSMSKLASKENILANQSTTSAEPSSNSASKRPKNTALKQQRLPAWQPILTAKTVLPLFFTIGVVFVILGSVLLHFSNTVNEQVIDYTDCSSSSSLNTGKCSEIASANTSCSCTINFHLTSDYPAPVYLYYGLSNFYQNHRRYVKSRDDNQLLGKAVSSENSECAPYGHTTENGTVIFYAPCGAIANSLFNDTFKLRYNSVNLKLPVQLLATGIAWATDKAVKFKNPPSWENTQQPKNWDRPVYNLSSDPDNNGYRNEDLIVWMRTAALPTFRKFYRRVDHSTAPFTTSLPRGNYSIEVEYNYPVVGFGGRKTFVISTTTWIGGKNPFLGIAYLVVGSLCIVLGFVFLVIHFKFSRNGKSDSNGNVGNGNGGSKKPSVSTVESPES